MGICPCKDCFDRKLLCHSQCRKYQDWKTEFEAMKAETQEPDMGWSDRSVRKMWRNMRWGRAKYQNRVRSGK